MNDLATRIQQHPLSAVIEYYAERLSHNPRALAFLHRRGLSSEASLWVGFADRTLGKQLPTSYVKAGRELRSLLQTAGILKANGREVFRGHVTVPLSDLTGTASGLYGLRVDPTQGEKENTLGSGIFNAAALTSFREIILCESLLDAWTFCAARHNQTIAIEGVKLSREMFNSVDRILLAGNFDHELFRGKELLQIVFPEGVSPAQYASQNRAVDDCLGRRIRAAEWISGAPVERSETASSVERSETTSSDDVAEEGDAKPQPVKKPSTPAASPVPQPLDDLPVEHSELETIATIENRRWRIRGLDRNAVPGVMRVNVAVFNDAFDRFHVDSLDLYQSRARRSFLSDAAEETGLSQYDLRSDLARVLMKLEQLQHQQLSEEKAKEETVTLTGAERSEAMQLLQDERLLDRILDDFEVCGIVGEHAGKLAGYLVATSRLLEKPLGLVIQSSSAAGKSALADSILKLMPPESLFRCSAMTGQSLYYLGKENLQHKILSIAEEEGVTQSAYQLKLLQSEGSLSLVATSKETGTGRTSTERYDVRGPVALMMTTTSLSVDPELLNRCLVIAIDESVAQTEAILQQQRQAETLDGWQQQVEQQRVIKLHHNAQRLLRPLRIVNRYADQLKFVSSQTRHRRDHQKYLSLIKAVTLLYQYQHEVKQCSVGDKTVEYLEVTRADIARANTIADWALGRSIDELSGPTRRLLVELYDWVRETADSKQLEVSEIQFTRRQAREALGWSASPMRIHLERLCLHEYVLPHGGGNGRLYRYSLLYDGRGREGQQTLPGLIDSSSLTDPPASTTSHLTDSKTT